MERCKSILLIVLRWLLGAVFIFSGVVKSVDPVGTSVFVEKYLAVYSLDVLLPVALPIAIILSVVEMLLGILLICAMFERYVAIATTLFLSLFTLVTLLNATILPIGDCGCFGDALKLTPWQTLLKNVVMLPVAVLLWRRSIPVKSVAWLPSLVTVVVAVALSLGINLYSLRHLPLIDFMPYKVDTNLLAAVERERAAEVEATKTILVFNNRHSGKCEEYPSDAVDCWSNPDLEYVDARTVTTPAADATYGDFRLYDSSGEDVTLRLLRRQGRVAWLCVSDASALSGRHLEGVERLIDIYPSSSIVIVTSADCRKFAERHGLKVYNMDAMTLRSIMRAKVGVVVMNKGVIEYKADIRDI